GLQAWYDGEYESAAARFERSLHSFPEFAMTNYYLAVCYQEMDKWDWAVRRFDLALQLTRSGDLAHQVAVRRIAHEAGVPVVDMPMLLELNAAPDLFIDAGHLGPAGYEIQARETLRVLAPLLEVDPERLNPGE
ncbi:hypothetical protein JW905_09670, partial [bacterium]|nr:hypothetical protein [candidate division CSSED10-310 bacterium]